MTTPTLKPAAIPQWTLGDRMRKAREHAGLDQTEIADAIEIARQSVSNYENSHTKPGSRWILRQWAEVTGVDYHWLAFGQEPADSDDSEAPAPGLEPGTLWFHDRPAEPPSKQEILALRKTLTTEIRANVKNDTRGGHESATTLPIPSVRFAPAMPHGDTP